MAETYLFKDFKKKLAALSDQIYYFLFTEEEFYRDFSNFGEEVMHHYTSHVYSQNNYSKRIYVTLKELPEFQKTNRMSIFGAYYSTSYEVLSGYIEESLDLLEEINTSTFTRVTDKAPEDEYVKSFNASGYSLPDQEIIDTLSYLRLRRNHFTHLNPGITNRLNTLINTKGNTLNTYWSRNMGIRKLDFTNKVVFHFEEEETIDLLAIMLVILVKMDNHLLTIIDRIGTLEFIAKKELKPVKMNDLIAAKLANRLIKIAEIKFGITCTVQEAIQIVKDFCRK